MNNTTVFWIIVAAATVIQTIYLVAGASYATRAQANYERAKIERGRAEISADKCLELLGQVHKVKREIAEQLESGANLKDIISEANTVSLKQYLDQAAELKALQASADAVATDTHQDHLAARRYAAQAKTRANQAEAFAKATQEFMDQAASKTRKG